MPRSRRAPYKSCKYGHTSGTYPDGLCKECNRISKARSRVNVQFKPCIHGHTSGRHANGICKDCQRLRKGATARGTVDRQDLPCKHGHVSGRFFSGECIDCSRERQGRVKGRTAKPRRGSYLPHPLVEKMRDIRKKLGLSQQALDLKAGVSERTVAKLESGEGRVAFLGPLAQVAAALEYNLVLIPRAYREHSQYTINQASAAVCTICETDRDAVRGTAGTWTHHIGGRDVKCYASAIREALYEPVTDIETDLLKHRRDVHQRSQQRSIEKRRRDRNRSDDKEQKTAQRKLDARAALKSLRE